MIKFLVCKPGGKFKGKVLGSDDAWTIKGELPCLIGALVLANHAECRDGFEVLWDDSSPTTRRDITGGRYGLRPLSDNLEAIPRVS